jgi:hypothetical protein
MGFGDLVKEIKKNNAQRVPSGKPENLVEATERTPIQKKDISYKDSEIKGFVPSQRTIMSRQNLDSRCGSIIRNIASESSIHSQTCGETTWEQCKYRKNSNGKDFCSEYHSLCAKENCRKARK